VCNFCPTTARRAKSACTKCHSGDYSISTAWWQLCIYGQIFLEKIMGGFVNLKVGLIMEYGTEVPEHFRSKKR